MSSPFGLKLMFRFLLAVSLLFTEPSISATNGFDLSNSEIPLEKIYAGGPPRDGIPSIDTPHFLSSTVAESEIKDHQSVLGIEIDNISRAYPIAILNWHEVVNDKVNGRSIVISYCPLCGSGMVFSSTSSEGDLEFGVSGLLYNSDVLLYDRQSSSLWSQLMGKAISGPMQGTKLHSIPATHTTWGLWKSAHPDTTLLSRETGFQRDYDRDPYKGYTDHKGIYFPVETVDPGYHPKERVLGIEVNGRFKGYPYSELSRTTTPITEQFNGLNYRVYYDQDTNTARATDLDNRPIVTVSSFWFAWMAFHPDSKVFTQSDLLKR
jgi:hypothetical protein